MNTIIKDLITKWGITVNPTLLEYIVIMCSFFSLVLVLYLITKLVHRDASSNRTMFVKCALVFIGILVCLSAFSDFGCNLIYGGGDTSEPIEPGTPTLKDGFYVYEKISITSVETALTYDGFVVVTADEDDVIIVVYTENGIYRLTVPAGQTAGVPVKNGNSVSIDTPGYFTAYIARNTTLADALVP